MPSNAAARLEIIAENTAEATERLPLVVFFTNGPFDGIIPRYTAGVGGG